MIVVDTSALAAVLFSEADEQRYFDAIASNPDCRIAAPTALELLIVAENRRNPATRAQVRELLAVQHIKVVDWTSDLVQVAEAAFLRFGKGRHPAKLNFGDCMSYALAKSLDAPLLYKGDDFALTDIRSAVAR